MTDPNTCSTKQYASFCCFLHDTFAKCLDSERDGVSHEAVNINRPVRQRTVRSETTKGKVSALPPAVYTTINHHKHKLLSTLQSTSPSFPYK